MRGLILFLLVLIAILGAFALAFPAQVTLMSQHDGARIIYLTMLALFIGMGAFGMRRWRGQPVSFARGLVYVLIWAAAFAGAVLLVQLVQSMQSGGRVLT